MALVAAADMAPYVGKLARLHLATFRHDTAAPVGRSRPGKAGGGTGGKHLSLPCWCSRRSDLEYHVAV